MRSAVLVLLAVLIPSITTAQSSQFGVRGLGYPGRSLAVRSLGSGGAFGFFDPESSQNPTALDAAQALTASFTASQGFRTVENPAGRGSLRDTRFPQLMIAGPIPQRPAALGLSYSNYTDRDFTLATAATLEPRGITVNVSDTLSSRGGLSDLRVAGAYRVHNAWTLGIGLHVISGSNRLTSTQVFDDPHYLPSRQRAELSYTGVGISAGVTRQFGAGFAVAALARSDGHLNVDVDSTRTGTIDLPYSFGVGLQWKAGSKLSLAGQTLVRTWSGANSDLLRMGGTGAQNTVAAAIGAEYTSDPKRPYRRPIRLGARYATLPFPLIPGQQGHEFGISAGSGLRFAQQRAGIDLALEQVWRSENGYSERAFIVSLGISVRP